jgi:tetratricopeptide (TPR) repeat protein
VGNALRILGDLPGAARAFAEAERLLVGWAPDPLVVADLLSLRASLAHYQRDFPGAMALLERAISIFASIEQIPGLVKALLKLATVHDNAGEPRRGIAFACRALSLAGDLGDLTLRRTALQNLSYLHAAAGDPRTARALVARARPLFECGADRLDRWRFDWLAARIDLDLRLAEPAAARLERLRETYSDERLPFEAALVSLDLAAAYAALGRRAELTTLLAESAHLLRGLGVGRETLATLSLLAESGTHTVAGLVRHLASALEEARARTGTAPEAR